MQKMGERDKQRRLGWDVVAGGKACLSLNACADPLHGSDGGVLHIPPYIFHDVI